MPNKKKDYQIWTDQNTWADVFARFNKKKQKKNHSNKYILIAILFFFVGLIVSLNSLITLQETRQEVIEKEIILHNLNLKVSDRLKMGVREEIIHLAGIYGVDEETALRIAECESQFNKYPINWEGSTAQGVYMWTDPSWKYIEAKGSQLNQTENIRQFMIWYPEHKSWWKCK